MIIDTTIEEMRESSDWGCIFRRYASFTFDEVDEVLASAEGGNAGPNWVAVFRLKDGRFAYLTAGCEYTGWECGGIGDSETADSIETIAVYMTDDDKSRLGWSD